MVFLQSKLEPRLWYKLIELYEIRKRNDVCAIIFVGFTALVAIISWYQIQNDNEKIKEDHLE